MHFLYAKPQNVELIHLNITLAIVSASLLYKICDVCLHMEVFMPAPVSEENNILFGLDEVHHSSLINSLEYIEMPLGMVLHEPNQLQEYVYFPTSCIVSLIYVTKAGASIEIAVIGFEGMVGLSSALGGITTTSRAIVQSAGNGYRIKSAILKHEFETDPALKMRILRFAQALITMMGQTAVCNRHHSVEQQVSKWLLMMQDRKPQHLITMTHELIANMLGVRREGVTEAAGRLQKHGYIRYSRGLIEIIDREGLEDQSCECYALVKKEYERLSQLNDRDSS